MSQGLYDNICIEKGKIIPINRSIEFAGKFPDQILNKTQLKNFQIRFLIKFPDTAILYDRLKKNPKPWTESHTLAVQKIKKRVISLPCLMLANPNWKKIIETDASDIGYGGILKQVSPLPTRTRISRAFRLQPCLVSCEAEPSVAG